MNEPITPTAPPILPKAEEPVNYGPVGQTPAPPTPSKRKFPIWMLVVIVILLILLVTFLFQKTATPSQIVTPQESPTPTVMSIQTHPLSSIASDSAFIEFEAQLDIVTRGIQNAPIDNQSLLPPRLDLPLGF